MLESTIRFSFCVHTTKEEIDYALEAMADRVVPMLAKIQKTVRKGEQIMYKAFLIKYGEIAIKGKNRHLFEDALVRQICYALKQCGWRHFSVHKEQGRIYVRDRKVTYDYEETVEALQPCVWYRRHLPGCAWWRIEGFDKLAEQVCCEYLDQMYPDKHMTFKVNARRARKNYPMDSMEINASLGRKDSGCISGNESGCASIRM